MDVFIIMHLCGNCSVWVGCFSLDLIHFFKFLISFSILEEAVHARMSVSDRVNHHNRAARQIRLIVHLLYSESVEIILLLLVTNVEGLSS